ncbi:MAG: hypothetical protein NC485_14695 [Ruminococcus flavefaciens]|nr:hypothetical protein [Ruminococcus flavefaciens]
MADNERKELLQKAKPILFNTDMVRAILDGRKTVTRRIVKNNPEECTSKVVNGVCKICDDKGGFYLPDDYVKARSPYQVGDILYVRETWGISNMDYDDKTVGIVYRASENVKDNSYREIKFPNDKFEQLYNSMAENSPEWHPSIHMPKEAARIFLRVTNVRVERLQDITPEQIDAEGCKEYAYNAKTGELLPSKPTWFKMIWDSTIKKSDIDKYGWNANPFVFVIEFEIC